MFLGPEPNTEENSRQFGKQLAGVIISNILRARRLVAPELFTTRFDDGNPVYILSSSPHTEPIINWMRGAFKAIDDGYLREIILSVHYSDVNSFAFEAYSLTFQEKDITVENQTWSHKLRFEEIDRAWKNLIASIKKLEEEPIPIDLLKQAKLVMRLKYHEETPKDYQPIHFMQDNTPGVKFDQPPKEIHHNSVETDWQSVNLVTNSFSSLNESINVNRIMQEWRMLKIFMQQMRMPLPFMAVSDSALENFPQLSNDPSTSSHEATVYSTPASSIGGASIHSASTSSGITGFLQEASTSKENPSKKKT